MWDSLVFFHAINASVMNTSSLNVLAKQKYFMFWNVKNVKSNIFYYLILFFKAADFIFISFFRYILFFSENKGIGVITSMSHIDVNYKSALLLETKCRILMSLSNLQKLIEDSFFEADIFNESLESKNKPGRASELESVLDILLTD